MSSVYMGLGFYDIPNRFESVPFDSCVEVDSSVKDIFESSTDVLTWDGFKLTPLVIPTESDPV